MEMSRVEIAKFFGGLKFEEQYHTYYVNGEKIKTSVSGVVKNFYEPFDAQRISGFVAASQNRLQEDVLKEWNDNGTKACLRGNIAHEFGELHAFNREIKPRDYLEEAIARFWNEVPDHIKLIFTELQMYHKDFLFAGTADIVLYSEKEKAFIIGDYKTNQDIFKNYKGKKMFAPFEDLLDNPFNHYQLQLSLYQILLEQVGIKVFSRKIIWLRPDGAYSVYDTKDYTVELKKYLETTSL